MQERSSVFTCESDRMVLLRVKCESIVCTDGCDVGGARFTPLDENRV